MTTRATMRQRIARSLDDLPAYGTNTATTSSTIADTVNLLRQNDNDYKGAEVYIYEDSTSAVAVGQKRRATASTASTKLLTVPTWTNTPTTAVAKYELHLRWSVDEYNDAIDAAYDAVRKSHLLDKVDTSIILNSIAPNGLIANWTSTSALTSWAATTATLAQETSIIYSPYFSGATSGASTNDPRYSAKISVAAGTLLYTVPDYGKYGGQTLTVRAWVYTVGASNVRSTAVVSGSAVYSSYHGADGWNAKADLELTTLLAEGLTSLTVGIATATTTAAYLGRFEAYCHGKDDLPSAIHEYAIPSGFITIKEIEMETGNHGVFRPLEQRYWGVNRDAQKKLWIANPIDGRAIRITGQAKATKPTADSSTIELNEAFVEAYACARLLRQKRTPNEEDRLSNWERKAEELERKLRVGLAPSSIQVETVG